MKCSLCEDNGWVCESHPDKPWEGPSFPRPNTRPRNGRPQWKPGLGHNRGPDLDGELEVDEPGIQNLIALLKEQRANAPDRLATLAEAAKIADPAANKWRERLDEFGKAALNGAGR
jgi:hypothetical protein